MPWNHAPETDRRGSSSCCNSTALSRFHVRGKLPYRFNEAVPKLDASWAKLISQSEVRYTQPRVPCAMSSLLRSVHASDADVADTSGLYPSAMPVVRCWLYRFSENLSAVFALPRTS